MGNIPKNPGKEVLYRLHVKENKNIYEIAELYGVNRITVTRWLNKAGIPVKHTVPRNQHGELTREILEDLYVTKGLSVPEISEMLHIPENTIRGRIYKDGLKKKDPQPGFTGQKIEEAVIDTEMLRHLYEEEHLPLTEIAAQCGVSISTVRRRLDKMGIQRRQPGVRDMCGKKGVVSDRFPGEEQLRRMYIDQMLSAKDIAKICGISDVTVYSWLSRLGFGGKGHTGNVRPEKKTLQALFIATGGNIAKIAGKYGVDEETVKLWYSVAGIDMDTLPKKPEDAVLYQMYVVEKQGLSKIADAFGVSAEIVKEWLTDAEIPIRRNKRAVQKRKGENDG